MKVFLHVRKEIIDALKRSDERVEIYCKKTNEKMDKFDEHGKLLEENIRKDG